jgi:hypothetical protein
MIIILIILFAFGFGLSFASVKNKDGVTALHSLSTNTFQGSIEYKITSKIKLIVGILLMLISLIIMF